MGTSSLKSITMFWYYLKKILSFCGFYPPRARRYPTSGELQVAGVSFKAFDLGGHELARRIWRDYFTKVNAVVYLVDSSDHERFTESKTELHGLLTEELLSTVPFLILGNKIDIPTSISEEEMCTSLNLNRFTTGKKTPSHDKIRPLEVFMCSLVDEKGRKGYEEAFRWLVRYV